MDKIIVSNCSECPLRYMCDKSLDEQGNVYNTFENCIYTMIKTKTHEYQWYHPVSKKINEIKDLLK